MSKSKLRNEIIAISSKDDLLTLMSGLLDRIDGLEEKITELETKIEDNENERKSESDWF